MNAKQVKHIEYPTHEPLRLRFRIPFEWREDYSDPDIALFYLPLSHAEGPSPIEGSLFVFAYTEDTFSPELYGRRLPDGSFLSYAKEYRSLETHDAVIHRWVRRIVVDSQATSFVFAFTGVTDFFDTPQSPYYEAVSLLDREIQSATVLKSCPPTTSRIPGA
jgi:hypothetical protein